MEQEATHQEVNKIERTTHTIARKVAVPRRKHWQPEYKGCSYDLVGSTKCDSQPKEKPDHEGSGDERIEMRSDLSFVG